MIVTTAPSVEGYRIVKQLGLVHGIVVRSPTIGQGIAGGFAAIFGGNINSFKEMCEKGRDDAYNEMVRNAESMGANAIVAVRYDTTEIGTDNTTSNEVFCYGTAVFVEPKERE